MKWYQTFAEVICENEQLERGYVYVKANDANEVPKLVRKHVNDTWGTADVRIDYTVETKEVKEIDEDSLAENRNFFNRPENVFTSKDAIIS